MSHAFAPAGTPDRERQHDGSIDVTSLFRALGRKKWWVIIPTLAVLGLSFAGVNLVRPRYTADTKILLESRDSALTRYEKDQRSGEPTIDQDAVQSQVQQLNSRDLARAAVKKLNLTGNAEFDPMLQGLGPVKPYLITLGLMKNPGKASPEDRVLENYFDRLQAFSVRGSRVMAIEFTSEDPELAARAANTLAEVYLESQRQAKKDLSLSAGKWLNAELEPLRQKVAEAESRVEAYRTSSSLFQGSNNTSITNQQLSELNTQLSAARSQQADLQARAGIIRGAIRSGRIFEVTDVANNDTVRQLIRDRATLKAQMALEERTLLPSHPRIKELNAQLGGLEEQIRSAADRTARGFENDAKVAGTRVANVQAEIETQKKVASTANEADVQLRALEREAKTLREQYESYLGRSREATSREAENAIPADARIISRAIPPDTPSFPKKLPIILVSTLACLLLSSTLIITRELLSGRSIVREGAHLQGVVPAGVGVDEGFVREGGPDGPPRGGVRPHGENAYTRAVEGLVSDIRGVKPRGRGATIALMSPQPGSGATSTAISLGRALVKSGRTVLLELDQGRPTLARFTAARDPSGIMDVLHANADFGEAIHRDRASKLHMVPLGRDVRADAFAEHSGLLATALDALSETYDFIVCDSGIVANVPDLILQRADLALLIASGDEYDPDTVTAYASMKERGAQAVSVVLTPDEILPPGGPAPTMRAAA